MSSVMGDLNIVDNVGDYFFSDRKDVHGYHSVSLHDVTLFHSTLYDHCASIMIYLFIAI